MYLLSQQSRLARVSTVDITAVFGAGATASATVSGGIVTAITVLTFGSGYVNPIVTLSGGGGTNATVTATVINAPTINDIVSIEYRKLGGAAIVTNLDHLTTTEDSQLQIEYKTSMLEMWMEDYIGILS